MARCWSCGAEVSGVRAATSGVPTCPACQTAEGISEIASTLEWGFEEFEWKLNLITGILGSIGKTLGSIDKTLKTPSQTQANEWRQIAEELRRRGVLDESEKLFLKSLEANPLDYRTYIGLGTTYLEMGKLHEARSIWERSLPHAPKLGETAQLLDYKSYSYRLIGRTYFCEENYEQAASALENAIELSPFHYPAYYDYAQYCALIGDKENCLSSLRTAIINECIPFQLLEEERNFEPFRKEIDGLLNAMKSDRDFPKEMAFRANLKKLKAMGKKRLKHRGQESTWFAGVAYIRFFTAEPAVKHAEEIVSRAPKAGFWDPYDENLRWARRYLKEAKEKLIKDYQNDDFANLCDKAIEYAHKAEESATEKIESLERKQK